MTRKLLAILPVAAATLLLAVAPSDSAELAGPPAENVRIADLDNVKANQETPVWCWAACIEMVLSAGGLEVSQSEIVESVKGRIVAQTASNHEISVALSRRYRDRNGREVQLRCSAFGTPPVIPLINELAAGRPVILAYNTGPMSGHVVIAVEAQFVHDPVQGPTIVELVVFDPWTGQTRRFDPRQVPYTIRSSWFTVIEGNREEESLRISLHPPQRPWPRLWHRIWIDGVFVGYLGTHDIGGAPGTRPVSVRHLVVPDLNGEVRYRIERDVFQQDSWGQPSLTQSDSGTGMIDLDAANRFEFYSDGTGPKLRPVSSSQPAATPPARQPRSGW